MDLPPAEALRRLLIKHIRNITEDAYGGVLLTDLESLTPAQRKRYVAMRDRFEHGVREMIRGGIADGVFAPQNVDLAGITILGAINWIPKWYRHGWADVLRRDRRQHRRSTDPVAASMSSASMHPDTVESRRGVRRSVQDPHRRALSCCSPASPATFTRSTTTSNMRGPPASANPLAHGLLMVGMTALGASNARERIEGFVFVEQGCRFLKPTVVGDTIHPRFTVEKIWQDGERHYCRFKTAIINQRGETLLEGFHSTACCGTKRRKEKS